jgi:hypothetical protein
MDGYRALERRTVRPSTPEAAHSGREVGDREADVIHQALTGTTKLTTLRRADLDARFPGLLDAVLAGLPRAVTTGA